MKTYQQALETVFRRARRINLKKGLELPGACDEPAWKETQRKIPVSILDRIMAARMKPIRAYRECVGMARSIQLHHINAFAQVFSKA